MRPDSMKASHILISYKGAMRADEKITRTQDHAKKIADSLMTVLKKTPRYLMKLPKPLPTTPPPKQKPATWLVCRWKHDTPFNDACIKNKEGDLIVVETPFGYHVLKVTGKKRPRKKHR